MNKAAPLLAAIRKAAGSASALAGGGFHRIFAAQIYGQFVTIAVQLALVPILLHSWGAARYGTWLLISSIPAYLTMSDLGFTTVAKTLMVMRVANDDREGALRCYHTVFALVCIVAGVLLSLAAALYLGAGLLPPTTLDSPYLTPENSTTLLILIAWVLAYQFFLLVASAVRTLGRPAVESTYVATMRLFEAAGTGIAALSGMGLIAAAAAMLIIRVTMTLGLYLWTHGLSDWLRLGFAHASRKEFASLRGPAAAFMSIPLSQAMLMQAPIIALGAAVGPVAVAAFSTARTILRVGNSAINVLNATFVTRYSVLAGSGQFALFRKLTKVHLAISLACVAAYAGVAIVGGPIALDLLTSGKLHVGLALVILLTLSVTAEMIYSSALTALSAANVHATPSHIALAVSILSAGLCLLAAGHGGTNAVALVVLLSQLVILAAILWLTWRRLEAMRQSGRQLGQQSGGAARS
jgi:O-antigen/teichoic acid export membrane protein